LSKAEKTGVSMSHLEHIENGECFPSSHILRKISKPLNVDEKELFNLAGYLSGSESKEANLQKHKSLAELDILIKQITSESNRVKTIVRNSLKKS
jgi:transcriptional regulator with XRE-family HTH domain